MNQRKFWKQFVYGGNWEKHILVVMEILCIFCLRSFTNTHRLSIRDFLKKKKKKKQQQKRIKKKTSHLRLIYQVFCLFLRVSKPDTSQLLSLLTFYQYDYNQWKGIILWSVSSTRQKKKRYVNRRKSILS